MGAMDLIKEVLSNAATSATTVKRAEYVGLLKTHDWQYEFSDDQRVWRKGWEQQQRMHQLQRELDPQHELWNQHCPASCRRPPPPWTPGETMPAVYRG